MAQKPRISVNVGGGASGWLSEVQAAIDGTAATDAMRKAESARNAKAEGGEQEQGPILPQVKSDLAGGGGFLNRIGQFLKFRGL